MPTAALPVPPRVSSYINCHQPVLDLAFSLQSPSSVAQLILGSFALRWSKPRSCDDGVAPLKENSAINIPMLRSCFPDISNY